MVDNKSLFATIGATEVRQMNETSFTFALAPLRQNRPHRVSTKYMAARAFETIPGRLRPARAKQPFRLSRSKVSTNLQFDKDNSELLKESFRTSLPLPSLLDPGFEDALRHVLKTSGSMVRPRMVLRLGEAYDLAPETAHNIAIALEYFHTASLIFDDLPCMDDAFERRGVPCVHVRFGQSTAILSALALINRAYALMWRAVASCPAAAQAGIMTYIEQRLGVDGLLNGQSLDLHYSALPHTRETTERIARGKTVSLIRLTLVVPALLGGAALREIQLLERIAVCWGLGYQAIDDLKDVLQSTANTGKTAARDAQLDRPNIASAIGICAAVERLERLLHIGDLTLQRLLARRPALSFLSKLRGELETEFRRVTDVAPAMANEEACTRARS
jgi:geranylgeranyl diphosphate synthase, type II